LDVQKEIAGRGPKEYEAPSRAALAQKPDCVDAYNHLGYMLREVGRLDAAEQMCGRAVALNAANPSAIMVWGNVLEAQGLQAEAQLRNYKVAI
jgi:Flp pilus assembly protein TadD